MVWKQGDGGYTWDLDHSGLDVEPGLGKQVWQDRARRASGVGDAGRLQWYCAAGNGGTADGGRSVHQRSISGLPAKKP